MNFKFLPCKVALAPWLLFSGLCMGEEQTPLRACHSVLAETCSCSSHATGRERETQLFKISELPDGVPRDFSVEIPHGDGVYTLQLEKNAVFGENTRFLLSDESGQLEEVELGLDRSYLGRVSERPDFVVSAVLGEDGLIASIIRPGRESILVSPVQDPVQDGDRTLHQVSVGEMSDHRYEQATEPKVSEVGDNLVEGETALSISPIMTSVLPMVAASGTVSGSTATLPPTRVMDVLEYEIGVEIGFKAYRDSYGSNLTSAQASAQSVIGNMDARYLRAAGIKHRLGTVIIRTTQAGDPLYNSITRGNSASLSAFRNYWNGNPGEVGTTHDLAVYHVKFSPSGIAYVNSVGTSNRYALSCSNGATSWADGTLAHEFGHSWNLRHNNDPPISVYDYSANGTFPSRFYEARPRNNSGMSSSGGSHNFVSIMNGSGTHNIGRLSTEEANTMYSARQNRRGPGDLLTSPGPIPPFGRMDLASAGAAPVTIDVIENDYDCNNDVLDVALLDSMSHRGGTVSLSSGTGSGGRNEITYEPPTNFTGIDFFHYTVCDTSGRTDFGAVYVTVAGPVVVDTNETEFDYDFGTQGSPVQGGWTAITPGTYGDVNWSDSVNAIDRGTNPGVNNINRDFVTSSQTRTLNHKIGDGLWSVTINMGDVDQAREQMKVSAENGAVVKSGVNSVPSEFVYVTFQVAVTDGELNIEFSDEGGSSVEWVITRMSLTRATPTEDSDGDGLPDFYEDQYYGHPTANTDGTDDFDNDGLTDTYETQVYGHPVDSADASSDFDNDDLTDLAELNTHGTDPLLADTDGDGFDDGLELVHADPLQISVVPALSVASTTLKGYWPFDETSGGTANDASGNGMNGIWNGDVDANVWVAGLIGGASQSNDEDGGNDEEHYRIANLSSINGASSLSISLWFRQNVDTNNNSTYNGLFMTRGLLSSFGGGGENWGIALEKNNTPRAIDWRVDGASGGETNNVLGNTSDEWYHVLFVWDGVLGTRALYQDGVLLSSGAAPTGSITSGAQWRIGDDSCCGNREFTGSLDDLAVFTSALDGDDAALLNDAGRKAVAADALLPGLDTDEDNLADVQERFYFGSLTATSGLPGEDFDFDGVDDVDELAEGTNPANVDTDGDGYGDGVEADWLTSPTDETAFPRIPGLVAYYPFNEGAGRTAFDVATENGAQDAEEEQGVVDWTSNGRVGGALDLGGSSSLLAADAIPTDATAFTISAWVNPDSVSGYKGLFSGRNSPGNWGLNLNASGSSTGHADFRFANSGGSSFPLVSADNSIMPNQWHHLAITWSADDVMSTSRAFLNGVEVAAPSAGARLDYAPPTEGFFIGDDPCCNGREFDGQLDDLAVFASALSPEHIKMIYDAGVVGRSVLATIEPELVLSITDIASNPLSGDVTIEWDSSRGNPTYSILSTTDLSLPIESWTVVVPAVNNGGPLTSYTHVGAANTEEIRFYVVREN